VLILTSTVFLYGSPLMDAVTHLTAAPTGGAPTLAPTTPRTSPHPLRST
jgi:hypothetical protein